MSARTAIAFVAASLAAGLLLALPTASTAADRPEPGSSGHVPAWGNDGLTPPPGTPPLRRGHAARMGGPGAVYDMHIYLLSTPTRPAVVTQSQMQAYVSDMNAYYAGQLGLSAPTFRVKSFTTVPTQEEDICGVSEAEAVIGKPSLEALTPTAGAVGATWLIVSPDVTAGYPCSYGGQAWLNAAGAWARHSTDAVQSGWFYGTLVHEIGHNLGLTHASMVNSRNGVLGWQGDGSDTFEVYADAADPMGSGPYVWSAAMQMWTYPTVGLQGHNRNLLGGVSSSGIGFAPRGTTTTVTLAPSTATSGTQLLYIPLFNRAKFYLEYRVAVGADAPLTPLAGNYGPGAGVYLRMVNTREDIGPDDYDPGSRPPYWSGTGSVSWSAVPWAEGADSYDIRQAFRAGESMTLPDGTSIRVLSMSGSGAQVSVTRPTDAEPPSFVSDPELEGCGTLTAGDSCTLRLAGETRNTAAVTLTLPTVTDNQWVTSLAVSVDGAPVVTRTSGSPGRLGQRSGLAEGSTAETLSIFLPGGRRTITFTATDLSGRTLTQSATVDLTVLQSSAAPSSLTWQREDLDAGVLGWTPPTDTGGLDIDRYWIERSISGGPWTSVGTVDDTATYLEDLPLSTPLRFRVAAETEAGVGTWGVSQEITLRYYGKAVAPTALVWQQTTSDAGILRWTAPTDTDGLPIERYWIEQSVNGGAWEAEGVISATTVMLEDRPVGTPFRLRVAAETEVGLGSWGTSSSLLIPLVTEPGPPTNVTATAGNGRATVAWRAPANDGGSRITGYTVTSSDGEQCTTTGLTCVVQGLTNGEAYYFVVVATNAIGDSDTSAPSASVTPAGLPGKVTNVRGSISGKQVRVTWSPPSDTGGAPITGYRYRVGTAPWVTTTTAAFSFTMPPRTTWITISIQATNRVGSGPVYSQRVRGMP